MIKEIRAKAKNLYSGNILLFCLYLAVCIMMIFCINLLPLVYEEFVSYSDSYMYWQYSKQIDFLVSVVLLFISVFVYYCLSSSVTRCFMKRAMGKDVGIDDVFYFFSPRKAFENFGLRISLTFIKLTALLFFMIPFAICTAVIYILLSSSVSVQVSILAAVGAIVFLIVGFIFYRRFSCLLFLCTFMICSDKKRNMKNIVKTSVNIMKDKTSQVRKIRKSFIGCFLLCAFIVPLGYVWIYYTQTMTLAAQKFIKEYA